MSCLPGLRTKDSGLRTFSHPAPGLSLASRVNLVHAGDGAAASTGILGWNQSTTSWFGRGLQGPIDSMAFGPNGDIFAAGNTNCDGIPHLTGNELRCFLNTFASICP